MRYRICIVARKELEAWGYIVRQARNTAARRAAGLRHGRLRATTRRWRARHSATIRPLGLRHSAQRRGARRAGARGHGARSIARRDARVHAAIRRWGWHNTAMCAFLGAAAGPVGYALGALGLLLTWFNSVLFLSQFLDIVCEPDSQTLFITKKFQNFFLLNEIKIK